jgi:hypothetical protein
MCAAISGGYRIHLNLLVLANYCLDKCLPLIIEWRDFDGKADQQRASWVIRAVARSLTRNDMDKPQLAADSIRRDIESIIEGLTVLREHVHGGQTNEAKLVIDILRIWITTLIQLSRSRHQPRPLLTMPPDRPSGPA